MAQSNGIINLEAFNIWLGGSQVSSHYSLGSVTIPENKLAVEKYTPGGAAMPINLTMGILEEPPELGFKLIGFDKTYLRATMALETQTTLKVMGALRQKTGPDRGKLYNLEINTKCVISGVKINDFERGKLSECEFSTSEVFYYQLIMDGEIMQQFDYDNNTFITGGIDHFAGVNTFLGI